MSYQDDVTADRRLLILELLMQDHGMGNERVIESGLTSLGHRVGVDRAYVREQMKFLETTGCVTIDLFRDTVMVATITERGAKVSKGFITVDGVTQPTPGA
ncbi:MAG: hypothetical protein P0Y50_08890 [Candidatus Brevundimonas colombiensis]|uniref:ArsR family transcriptional regulator n=1 Tax=Candidatus Brevundimonas colombiensis TaxID=3121376 RepID=A0AAJ5X067_9CAUL|nr:hypothetical protein [Brevundimonas sp.]WEK38668.1 MAG: hypothetical protein P0Y50_08890 [Brevundimonas sp.]